MAGGAQWMNVRERTLGLDVGKLVEDVVLSSQGYVFVLLTWDDDDEG